MEFENLLEAIEIIFDEKIISFLENDKLEVFKLVEPYYVPNARLLIIYGAAKIFRYSYKNELEVMVFLLSFLLDEDTDILLGHLEILDYLLGKGHKLPSNNPDEIIGGDHTPLYKILERGKYCGVDHPRVPENITIVLVEILLKYGANPNYAINLDNEKSCLSFTLRNLKLMKLLVRYGGNILTSKGASRHASLLFIMFLGYKSVDHLEIIKFLVENGANINEISTNLAVRPPIIFEFVMWSPPPYMDIILKYLIENGLNLNIVDSQHKDIVGEYEERLDLEDYELITEDIDIDIPIFFKKYREPGNLFDDYGQYLENRQLFTENMIQKCINIIMTTPVT